MTLKVKLFLQCYIYKNNLTNRAIIIFFAKVSGEKEILIFSYT